MQINELLRSIARLQLDAEEIRLCVCLTLCIRGATDDRLRIASSVHDLYRFWMSRHCAVFGDGTTNRYAYLVELCDALARVRNEQMRTIMMMISVDQIDRIVRSIATS